VARKPIEPRAVVPLGDCAAYIEFADKLDLEVNAFVQQLAAAIHARARPWMRDVVPALGGIALHYDPDHPDVHGDALEAAAILVQECMKDGAAGGEEVPARTVEVPVCYEREFAPDIEEVARQVKLDVGEIARTHAAGEYRVLMIGFAPGHASMSGLDAKLAVPRRAAPRALVAPGAVAIANEQTVVYPYAISGGWSVIGRTPLAVFDAAREAPSLLAPGDRVRFRPISAEEFLALHK
jgi:KipI family sensor histidine kinase inhibitor